MTQGALPAFEASLGDERALLGCVLVDPAGARHVHEVSHVRSGDFHSAKLRELWRALRMSPSGELAEVRDRVPEGVVRSYWRGDRHALLMELMDLVDVVPTGVNAGYYAAAVLRHAAVRRLWAAGVKIQQRAQALTPDDTPTGLLNNCEEILAAAEATRSEAIQASQVGDVVPGVMDLVQRMQSGEVNGIPTGFRELDEVLGGGFQRGELTLIAGRPSMGKTSFLSNVLANACERRHKVAVFSIEVEKHRFSLNMIAARAGVSVHAIQTKRATPDENSRFVDHALEVGQWPLYLIDRTDLTVEALASESRRLVRECGVELLAVDYAQIVKTEEPKESEVAKIGYVSAALKRVARDLDVPMVALAQLRRPPPMGAKGFVPPPALSDLKGSGALEETADVAILLHRPEYYATTQEQRDERAGIALAMVKKNRNGPQGDVRLEFHKEIMRFEEPRAGWKPRSKR